MIGFSKNARVCFLGDSITRDNSYVTYISAYYHEFLKEQNVNFYNCGVSGGRLSTILALYDEDVLSHKPTHAVIMFGINDSSRGFLAQNRSKERYEKLHEAFEQYQKNLELLCAKLRADKVEIIICTPPPYEEYMQSDVEVLPGGYALMAGYAEYLREFARKHGYLLCDHHGYFSKQIQEEALYTPDRVHPNEMGQFHIAKHFLQFQGINIGEKKPFPDYMKKWRELVARYSYIRSVEHLIIKDHFLSTEESVQKVKQFLEVGAQGMYKEFITQIAEAYLVDKYKQKEIADEISYIMEQEFKK